MPAISVILAVYNGSPYLKEAIFSVLNQTFNDFEFIIVDDGSTHDSAGTIISISNDDERIRYFHKDHSGLAASLNHGLNNAKGELIARIDADDIWLPNKLEHQLNYLRRHKEIKLLGCSVRFINHAGCPLKKKGFNRGSYINSSEILHKIVRNNLFCHSSVIFYRKIFESVSQYDESFVSSLDYDLWIRVLKSFLLYIKRRISLL